jgi:hypothetical protein
MSERENNEFYAHSSKESTEATESDFHVRCQCPITQRIKPFSNSEDVSWSADSQNDNGISTGLWQLTDETRIDLSSDEDVEYLFSRGLTMAAQASGPPVPELSLLCHHPGPFEYGNFNTAGSHDPGMLTLFIRYRQSR